MCAFKIQQQLVNAVNVVFSESPAQRLVNFNVAGEARNTETQTETEAP